MTLIPTQVTFHGLSHSDAVEAAVRERVAWLEQFYPRMVRCHVTLDLAHRHQRDGRHVRVRVELTVPGGAPIVVSREPSLHGALQDAEQETRHKTADIDREHRHVMVAVRRAFDAARRRLEDFAREQRADVKTHLAPAHGEVVEVSAVGGSGFIEADGRRIPFTRASVLDDGFEALAVGDRVAFVEEPGDEGPQAGTVRVLGKHHDVARTR